MKAGKTLDLLIQAHFFPKARQIEEKNVPPYSTNIKYAFKILEYLKKEQCKFYIGCDFGERGGHWCTISPPPNIHTEVCFRSDSITHAICVAALLYRGFTISKKIVRNREEFKKI